MSSVEHQERSLREAIRQARTTHADRMDVLADLNSAVTARLELLMDELKPVLAELPGNADQFECSLVPGDPPRLWLDMISYVAMADDKRTYRLVKDTRAGREVLFEAPEVGRVATFVTDYLAHRVVEREMALESGSGQRRHRRMFDHTAMVAVLAFLSGTCVGALGLFVLALVLAAP